jgi:hypothetical protein
VNLNTWRWAHLVWWEEADLRMLHRREKLRNSVNDQGIRVYMTLGLGGWKDESFILKLAQKYQLLPYWSPNMDAGDQANRISDFERNIYPVWARVEKMMMDKDAAAKSRAEYVKEEDILHAMDIAVCGAGHRPDRSSALDTAAFKKREKLIDQAKLAKGDDPWYHR